MADCQNLVLTCMDFRFGETYENGVKSIGESDRIALAGASKALVDEDTRYAVLKQVELAIKLHSTRVLTIIDHEDCGGYGGKASVSSDEEELEVHKQVMFEVRQILSGKFPDLEVVFQFAKLDGSIIDIDLSESQIEDLELVS